jgi:hypothetical protein
VTSLEEFTERYSGRRFLPPSDVLCEELATFAPDVAAHHRAQGNSKKQIVRDLGIRYGSGRYEQSGAGARLRR